MKVVIIELNGYHTETFRLYENLLPSFLKCDTLECHYFCRANKAAELRTVYPHLSAIVSPLGEYIIKKLNVRKWFLARKIQRLVDTIGADAVVFNSIEPPQNLAFFKGVKAQHKIAIIHQPAVVTFTKEVNEHYFVLSERVYENFKMKLPLCGYLLPFFKPYPVTSHEEQKGVLTVGVQGNIEFDRRDYGFLVELARKLKLKNAQGIEFSIIGSSNKEGGRQLRELIAQDSLEGYFRLGESFNEAEFFNEVERCDLLMPLIGWAQRHYYQDKTTATLSHAAAFNKPMLMSRENAEAWDLDETTQYIYEDLDSCAHILCNVGDLTGRKEAFGRWREARLETNRTLLVKSNG